MESALVCLATGAGGEVACEVFLEEGRPDIVSLDGLFMDERK